MTAQILPFPIITLKTADRDGPFFRCYHCKRVFDLSDQRLHLDGVCLRKGVGPIVAADRPQAYQCIECGERMTWPWRINHAVYCEHDGAEMRPVEK